MRFEDDWSLCLAGAFALTGVRTSVKARGRAGYVALVLYDQPAITLFNWFSYTVASWLWAELNHGRSLPPTQFKSSKVQKFHDIARLGIVSTETHINTHNFNI